MKIEKFYVISSIIKQEFDGIHIWQVSMNYYKRN